MLYYFLGTLLPELQIGQPPEIKLEEFIFLLRTNLTPADFKKIETLRRYFDIDNIRSFWSQLPMDEMGNFGEKALEEALLTRFGLPEYVYYYLDKYETLTQRIDHFAELQSLFFREEIQANEGFLKKLLIEERKLRLVLAALRAKKLKMQIAPFLQFEDPEDSLVRQILAQQDAEEYIPPAELEEVALLFFNYSQDPVALYKACIEYRFKKVSEEYGLEMFTIEKILGYMFQLILVEGWESLYDKFNDNRAERESKESLR